MRESCLGLGSLHMQRGEQTILGKRFSGKRTDFELVFTTF